MHILRANQALLATLISQEPAQIDAGKKLYVAEQCATCHGADLKGSDKGSNQGPPLLHKIYEPSHHGV